MRKNVKKMLIVFALILTCLCSVLFTSSNGLVCYASIGIDGTSYTNVLEDLKKDTSFSVDDYVVDTTDYSLKVIQVAESDDKELFIYVYQPCSPNVDLKATSINISTGIGDKLSYKNYSLTLLNSNGVFYKYKVRNFGVLSDTTRYYDISSIFRKWNAEYDEGLPEVNDNTISEVSFAVATRFTAKTMENGTVEYGNNGVDVVYITDKWCGFCRYDGGFELLGWADACDNWFVAFNTDKDIDRLIEADVYYVEQIWQHGLLGDPTYQYVDYLLPAEINEENINDYSKIAELDYTQKGEFQGKGWWASKYTWDRISTTENFIATENRENIYELGIINVKQETKLTDESLEKLNGKKWVLRFAETAYKEDGTTESHLITQSIVSNVSILRLKFETDGVVYNLGVIDNKQSADLTPDNQTNYSIEIADWFKILFVILMLILLVVVLAPFLPTVFSIVFAVVKFIFKAIIWVATLPFKLLKKIFNKGSDKS